MKIITVEESGAIAAKLCEDLDEKEQAMFVAGFQEAIKYLNVTTDGELMGGIYSGGVS
jgi:hypothetical protein